MDIAHSGISFGIDAPVLGRGTWGTVVLGREIGSKRKLAVKLAVDVDACDALQDEYDLLDSVARFLRKRGETLRDHCIIRPRGIGRTRKGRTFLGLEYCAGGSLNAYIKERGPLCEAEIRFVAAQLLKALALLSQCGILHADIKPANILIRDAEPLDEENDMFSSPVRLADFGVSVVPATMSAEQRACGYIGSRPYRAPELMRDEPVIGPAADMFSLGCVVVEMATGQRLFPVEPDSHQSHMERIQSLRVESVLWISSLQFVCLARDLLQMDPTRRLTAEAASRHPFFDAPLL